jgi:hypothetical protein
VEAEDLVEAIEGDLERVVGQRNIAAGRLVPDAVGHGEGEPAEPEQPKHVVPYIWQ